MMVDVHSHILPNVDDGAASWEDALILVEIASESGVEKIVATPHCNAVGAYENHYDEALAQKFRELKSRINAAGIDIELLPGMEVFANSDVPALLSKGKLLTLNCSRYVLTEFGFEESVAFTFAYLGRLLAMGCIPVVAHPERYPFVQNDPNLVFEWMRLGACTQVNNGSIFGKFGHSAKKTAMQLLNNDLVTVIASDAHDPEYRSTSMFDAYEYMESVFDEEYAQVLLNENPDRIVSDKSVLSDGPMPIRL